MGIIAGIFCFQNNRNNLKNNLMNMFLIQKHRDKSSPNIFIKDDFCGGMANAQNAICNGNISPQDSFQSDFYVQGSIFAFVDGIVLEGKKHKNYFEGKGYTIPHLSSSIIVALAYKEWGANFMSHLEGEFTCAVWDDINKTLVLARDPYGKKPLHYYYDDKKIIFSSEVKGVLAGGVPAEIDLISLSDFFSLNSIPSPNTIFKNIKQIEPGNIMIFSKKTFKKHNYWKPILVPEEKMDIEEGKEKLADSIRQAVKKRIFDGDTYCFLSGGIDSSAIVSFASELSSRRIKTITVGFDEAEFDELRFARAMAEHVNAEHIRMIARPESFFSTLDALVFYHDSPFSDISAYPTYFAAKLAKEHTDLILTGDGPDQTMGGSSHHVFAIKNNLFAKKTITKLYFSKFLVSLLRDSVKVPRPSFLSKIYRKLHRESLNPVSGAYDLRSYFPEIVKEYLCSEDFWEVHIRNNPYKRFPEAWFKEVSSLDDINKHLYADIKFYIPDDLMIKVDRMCMANSLETLSPFQDIELAKIINSLPSRFKLKTDKYLNVTTKFLLKEVCADRFPKELLSKQKQGFAIPLDKWLKQDGGEYIKTVLLDKRSLSRGYFNRDSLENFIEAFIKGKNDYFFASEFSIIALLTLELWQRKYIDDKINCLDKVSI